MTPGGGSEEGESESQNARVGLMVRVKEIAFDCSKNAYELLLSFNELLAHSFKDADGDDTALVVPTGCGCDRIRSVNEARQVDRIFKRGNKTPARNSPKTQISTHNSDTRNVARSKARKDENEVATNQGTIAANPSFH